MKGKEGAVVALPSLVKDVTVVYVRHAILNDVFFGIVGGIQFYLVFGRHGFYDDA